VTYRLLVAAREDLDHIEDWVVANFGEVAAFEALNELFDVFEMLANFPEAGQERPEVEPPPIRFFSVSPNIVIYEPGDPLLIYRIFPARTDIRELTL